MKIKGVIFDFGFTLFEFKNASVENYLNSYKEGLNKSIDILKQANIIKFDEVEQLFIKTFFKKRNSNFKKSLKTKREFPTHHLFKSVIESLDLEKLSHEQYQRLADLYHSHEEQQWIPLKNTRKTLKTLSENTTLKKAILSNHPNHNSIEKILKKYDLLGFFDAVVTSAEFGTRKPDPEIFLHTLRKLGLKEPSSCLMIGDEYADIMGGYRAGLKTILCKRLIRFPFEKEINLSEYIQVNDISEILDYVNDFN